VVLGNTTTLTEADRTFVERLAAEELTQEEFRALLQAHRNSQVDNASLRQLMGLDTLAASQVLRRLRDRSMLELHRAGAQSFYTLDPGLLAGDRPGQGNLVLDRGGLAADRGGIPADRGRIGPDRGELPTDRGELPADRGESGPIPSTVTGGDILDLDPALHQALASLGTRPRKEKLRQVIGLLCSDQWRTGAWLAQLLSYKPGNLANRHLGPMVKEGTLERRFPEKPNHPEQAYRSIPTPPPAIRVNLEREAQP
jgi:ATP-dependent DNA helicase RecG